MNLFIDTSALVKFFHDENGSEGVTNLIVSAENEIWVSELVRVEFLSALLRRLRNGEINDVLLDEAIAGFEDQITFFNVEPLGRAVIKEAEFLLKRYGKTKRLRTLDALHLGTFSLISEQGWFFVAADDLLCEIAKDMGFRTINPLR